MFWSRRIYRSSLHYVAWMISLIAVLGSLFFSEVMKLPPCELCWYQRIFMYPLALLLPIAILSQENKVKRYFLSLSLGGTLISTYHLLLYYHVIPDSIKPCSQGISCTSRQLDWLGFVSIPLLSWISFVLISLALVLYRPRKEQLFI